MHATKKHKSDWYLMKNKMFVWWWLNIFTYIHTENTDVHIRALTTKKNLQWYERSYVTEKCVKMSKWIKWTYANERWECPNVKSERTDNPPKWRTDQKVVQRMHAYFSNEWNERKNVLQTLKQSKSSKEMKKRREKEEGGRLSAQFLGSRAKKSAHSSSLLASSVFLSWN